MLPSSWGTDRSSALDLTDQAFSRQLPNHVASTNSRALVLFALQRYDKAATALYAILSTGPGWDWPTLIGLYSDVNVYTGQLRKSSSRPSGRIPVGRRRGSCWLITTLPGGIWTPLISQLKDVTQLQPRLSVATQLLRLVAEGATKKRPKACRNRTGDCSGSGRHDCHRPVSQRTASAVKEGNLAGTWTAEPSADQQRFA